MVAWSGYTEGYTPGEAAEFDIAIKNETGEQWQGRYCLQLLAGDSPTVIATLEQRAFTLEPGVGFSDTITVKFPDWLDDGAYGLSLPVRRPAGPMVDVVPIQVGDTDEVRRATTQRDIDASVAACPPVEGADQASALAKTDLAERLGIGLDEIEIQDVEPTEFPDASLGLPEPGKVYAQVITPGYVIVLTAEGETYRYHASDELVVPVPQEEGGSPSGRITIRGVQVDDKQVTVSGVSTLPEGSCVSVELWADGSLVTWWPSDACAPVQNGAWELVAPLKEGQSLQQGRQYIARAYQPGGPNIVATFPFDLDAPPTQTTGD